MQTVARDVGALNKVLSGTKTRGILGGATRANHQASRRLRSTREYATVENSGNEEYAIELPGQRRPEYVYLPIDSKFPLADYSLRRSL